MHPANFLLYSKALFLGLAKALQLWHQNKTYKSSRKTAVVQAETTMKQRHAGDKAKVQHGS